MAQSQVALAPAGAGHVPLRPAEDEIRQMQQCAQIVRLRDDILAGSHPRIKIPSHLAGKLATPAGPASTPTSMPAPAPASFPPSLQAPSAGLSRPSTIPGAGASANSFSFAPNTQAPSLHSSHIAATRSAKPFTTGNTEIDPVLLQKSDDLVRAEIKLQRQRIEKTLREQIDQQRAGPKTRAADRIADFDLSDVLTRALTLVQAAAAPPLPQLKEKQAGNISPATDSFDEGTFYSSRHDTTDPPSSPRVGNELGASQVAAPPATRAVTVTAVAPQPSLIPSIPFPPSQPSAAANAGPTQPNPQSARQPNQTAHAPSHLVQPYQPRIEPEPADLHDPSANTPNDVSDIYAEEEESGSRPRMASSLESLRPGPSDESRNDQVVRPQIPGMGSQAFLQAGPVMRGHDLSPLAPQPEHVSPLAAARVPPGPALEIAIPREQPARATPAQVAALRGAQAATSPESSPQGARVSDKKKSKKKDKRANKRGDRQAQEAASSPYIKPEPRSPSPLTAPVYSRPNKRQRQSMRQQQHVPTTLPLDEPGYEVTGNGHREHLQGYTYVGERAPVAYERPEDGFTRPPSRRVVSGDMRFEQEFMGDRRVSGGSQYIRRPQSPGTYSVTYTPTEVQPVRPASQMVVERHYRDQPQYYQGEREFARVGVRPEADRARSRSPIMRERQPVVMGPPRPVSTLVLDAYGREYIEPPRPPIARQSVAPTMRHGEPEIVYERAPIRAASTRPPPAPEVYEEDGIIYQRTSPAFGAPRRVITQPEYAAIPDPHRAYRQREYSARPMAPPGEEYIQVRSGPERRVPGEDHPREYLPRSASVRPADPVRYELPREYGRVQSVRPEAMREYVPSIPLDAGHGSSHQLVLPAAREYGGRPPEAPHVVRREYSVRPVERYYDNGMPPLPPPPRDEEVAYMERPQGATREIIYLEDGRPMEVYHHR